MLPRSSSRARLAATLSLAALVVTGPSLVAHEIGTTRVDVRFEPDRRYRIEVVTDGDALVEKLASLSDMENRGAASDAGAVSEARLAALDEVFRRRLKISFDGVEVRPAIDYAVSPPADAMSASAATIRLTGEIPADAQAFAWTYGWTFASYALTLHDAPSGTPVTEWLEGGQTSTSFVLAAPPPPQRRLEVAWRYFTLGFTHIVPLGFDHVLFVIGLFLLSGRARSLFWQISAFTIAHSITLGLSMYDLIAVPPALVEPLIALSIVYVAIENVFQSELRSWRVALVFAFGLLHGMGFAGALKELGLARTDFLTALLTFNVGVEAGQLAVIGAAFLLVGWHCRARDWYRQRVVVPASLAIACTALYWTVQRL